MFLLDSSHSTQIPWYIGAPIMVIAITLIIGGGLWVLLTLEERVEKAIYKKALAKGLIISSIRDTNKSDGKNPFGKFDFWISGSSEIFGFSG